MAWASKLDAWRNIEPGTSYGRRFEKTRKRLTASIKRRPMVDAEEPLHLNPQDQNTKQRLMKGTH